MIYAPENVGCFVLTRYSFEKASIDFRIYNLRGEALCSWKRKRNEFYDDQPLVLDDTLEGIRHHFDIDPYIEIDPYFGGYVINDNTGNVRIVSFTGDRLLHKKRSQLDKVSGWGIYEIVPLNEKKRTSILVNFLGTQIKTRYDLGKYSSRNYYTYIKR